MMTRRGLLTNGAIGLAAAAWARPTTPRAGEAFKVSHSDAEWRKLLTGEQYAVLRQSATERAFTSPLLHEARRGVFACAGCDLGLFSSTTRTAVHCSRCGGHLGHVFSDGPQPTGLRYCMNGVALSFKPA
jgi:peptide-methionine (R)-S-oxide reductase